MSMSSGFEGAGWDGVICSRGMLATSATALITGGGEIVYSSVDDEPSRADNRETSTSSSTGMDAGSLWRIGVGNVGDTPAGADGVNIDG
jgi:hypothetical protein